MHRQLETPITADKLLKLRSVRFARVGIRLAAVLLGALYLSAAATGAAQPAQAPGQLAPAPLPPPARTQGNATAVSPVQAAQAPAAPTVLAPDPVAPLPPSAADDTEYEYVPVEGPQTQAYEEAPQAPAAPNKDQTHCLLGELCFGPVLTAGVVDVFGIGAHARTDFWGIGFDYQFIRFTTRGVPVRLSLLTVEGRIYPFGGAFFIAGGLAWQSGSFRSHLTYPGNGQIPPIETDIAGSVNVPVFKLGAGFMGRSGFVMGIDLSLGLQLGGTRVSFSSDLPRIQEVTDVEDKIRARANTWIRGLPFLLQVNILRFGLLF